MKKVLFLTALFTSLLIGFASCSDNESFEEEWTEGLVGEPVYYTDVFGTLSYDAAESIFYFSAKESKDPEMLKKLGDKTYAIFPSEKILHDILKSNIGDVWLKVATTFSNSNTLYVSSIISEDDSRSID
jgi:hypothetical protein